MAKKNICLLTTTVILILISCSKDKDQPKAVVQKGGRQFGVHITQAESNSYDTEFQRVKTLGPMVIPFTIPWNTMETDAGFDFSTLDIIDFYYPANNTKVSLNITPLYAVNRAVPTDLKSKAFNDPQVISRFKVLIDSIRKHTTHVTINNFIIGLEADLYLTNHTTEWTTYKSFYDSASKYIKKKWSASMPVGVETTWSAAAITDVQNVVSLNAHSDIMVLSYYPEEDDFTVKAPTEVHSDVETIIGLYPTIPVFIVECGYQSSSACNSSDELQRQFIEEMFKLWDDHATKITFMGFLWLTDLSDDVVDQYVIDYGAQTLPSLPAFKGYLQTTGLRTYPGTGTDKAAYTELAAALKARGW